MSPRETLRRSVRVVQIIQGLHIHAQVRRADESSDSDSETEPLCNDGGTVMKIMHGGTRMRSGGGAALPSDIRQGFLAVYAGRERKRFVISTHFLSHRLFKALLKRSEEEFGFDYEGGLAIACEPVLFEHLLWLIGNDDPAARASDAELESLLDFYEF